MKNLMSHRLDPGAGTEFEFLESEWKYSANLAVVLELSVPLFSICSQMF